MKKVIYICAIALSFGMLAFLVTLFRFDDDTKKSENIVPIRLDSEIDFVQAESSIRINPISIEREEEKIATVSKPKEVIKEISTRPKKDIVFEAPFNGEVLMEFSNGELTYSETLKEWVIHKGIDIKGTDMQKVNSICDGIISDMRYDHNIGNIIEVKSGEYVLVYGCVEPINDLKIGDNVKRGNSIATLSNEMGFEFSNGEHLHLEVYKNGVEINPIQILKMEKQPV